VVIRVEPLQCLANQLSVNHELLHIMQNLSIWQLQITQVWYQSEKLTGMLLTTVKLDLLINRLVRVEIYLQMR
jgi:hypothetical protein